VVLVVMLIGTVPQLFSDRPGAIPKLVFFAIEAPAIMVALSLNYERSARRHVDTVRALVGSLALAAVVGVLCTVTFVFVAQSLDIKLDVPGGRRLSLPMASAFGVFSGLMQCGFWALGFVYPFAGEDARLRMLEADKLKLEAEKLKLEAEKLKLEAEKLRAAAELALLRSQLEPHFILNTLNAIAGLVTKRPKDARRLIGCLGDLLRDSLRDPEEMQTLNEEITWLRRYAEILESRHAEVLRFHWEVESDALGVLVPRLLLQPLVENAVNHGALQRPGHGEVTVRVAVERGERLGNASEYVVCTIEDNGPGIPDGDPRSGAFGLRSVRRRLELKYENANLRLESTSGGTRATVRLPRLS
jgi:signal transduction histidine kinase